MRVKVVHVHRAVTALCAVLATAASGQGLMSQELVPPAQETWVLRLGGIVNRFDSNVRLDGRTERGTEIDLEGNGLERNLSSFEASLTWRIAPRHRLDLQYYEAKRDGNRDYSREIVIDDETFPLGANIALQARSRIADLAYRYSFAQTPETEWAVLLGIYGGKFTYDLNVVGSTGSVTRTYNRTVSTTLPLPMIGITFDWYPDRRWKLATLLQGMKAQVGDIDGHAYMAAASLEYMFTRHLGMGARIAYTDIEADVSKGDFNGRLGWNANSVSLYGKLAF